MPIKIRNPGVIVRKGKVTDEVLDVVKKECTIKLPFAGKNLKLGKAHIVKSSADEETEVDEDASEESE